LPILLADKIGQLYRSSAIPFSSVSLHVHCWYMLHFVIWTSLIVALCHRRYFRTKQWQRECDRCSKCGKIAAGRISTANSATLSKFDYFARCRWMERVGCDNPSPIHQRCR